MGANGYIAKFVPQSISLNSDFSPSAWSMITLSASTDNIVALSGVTIAAADAAFTPATGTYINQTVIYTSISSTTSDVYYQILDESLSIIELNSAIMTIQLSCSFSGSTSISYSISSYGSSTVPSWITINSLTGVLTITAPNVSADTEFYFYATSSITGVSNPVQKLIKLTVVNCQVQNWDKCSMSSSTTWVTWSSGSTLNSDSSTIASTTSQVLSSTSTSALGASFWIITLISLINPASIASLWGMINQAQLFFLILLTKAFIPLDVQNVITGAKFALNIASYIFVPSYVFLGSITEQFDFSLSDKSLNLLSINSESSLFNFFPIILLIFTMIMLHLLVFILYKLMPTDDLKEWKWNWMLFVKLINKIFAIMTYGWYIRYIFQTNQYILISWIYEIYNFHVLDTKKITSLIFAIIVLCFCIVLIVFVFWLALSSYEVSKDNHNKIGEIFRGIKMQKISKFYVAILLIRRIIFIALLITLVFLQPWIVISILSLLQLWYLILLIIVRPFESKKNNIIELCNEIYFILLLSSLIHFNSEKDWSSQITQIYMWIMASNSFVTFLIIMSKCTVLINIVDTLRALVIIVKNRWSKPQHNGMIINSAKLGLQLFSS